MSFYVIPSLCFLAAPLHLLCKTGTICCISRDTFALILSSGCWLQSQVCSFNCIYLGRQLRCGFVMEAMASSFCSSTILYCCQWMFFCLDFNGYLGLYFIVLAVGYNHRFVPSTLPIWEANCNVVLLWWLWYHCFIAAALYITGWCIIGCCLDFSGYLGFILYSSGCCLQSQVCSFNFTHLGS